LPEDGRRPPHALANGLLNRITFYIIPDPPRGGGRERKEDGGWGARGADETIKPPFVIRVSLIDSSF
jgi:hypothetical protein